MKSALQLFAALFLLPWIACGADRPGEKQMKGVELYSWSTSTGVWSFSVLPGTNRLKTETEVKSAEYSLVGVALLRARFEQLAVGEEVFWTMHLVSGFQYPDEKTVADVVTAASAAQVVLRLPILGSIPPPTVTPVLPATIPLSATASTVIVATDSAENIGPILPPRVVALDPIVPLDIVRRGETSLQLNLDFGTRFVPPSRVTVPAGERVSVTVPTVDGVPAGGPIQWHKDGQPIRGATGPSLVLYSVNAIDSGTYQARYTDPAMAHRGSPFLYLGVGPIDRLLNLSTRATLNSGTGQGVTSGFVVAAGGAESKKLILRAIGPSLAAFGVTNALKHPILRVYDATGKPYQVGYLYPSPVGELSSESDLSDSLARCGAFPIPAGTTDAVLLMPFLPGSYTAEITSGDQTAGTVLLEIYEVP